MLAFGHIVIGTSLPVTALFIDLSAPPLETLHQAGVNEAKENNDDTKREARVKGGAERHGVFAPPSIVAVLDEVVEDITYDNPHGKVEAGGRRNPGHGAKDDGKIDLAEDAATMTPAIEPQRDGQEGTQREEPDQSSVGCVRPKELVGTDNTPKDGTIEVDSSDRASEPVDGFSGADSLDVHKHPVQHSNLGERGDKSSHNLNQE